MNATKSNSSDSSNKTSTYKVPRDLRDCHPLISRTRRALEECKWDHNGLIWARGTNVLTVKVSRAALHRALRIFQAVIIGAESRGWKVKGSTEKRESAIKVGEEDVALRLREKLKRFDNRSSESSWPTYTFKPIGLLTLEITDYIGATNKVAWWDTKTWPLENQIQDIVEGIGQAGEALRKLKIERAEHGGDI